MTLSSRLMLTAALLAAATLASSPARAAGILPENGDVISIATPVASPPVDHFTLVRIKPATGAVDSICNLPTGNGPLAITVAPWNGMVYVLGKTSLYRVDPCTGSIAVVSSGGLFAPLPPICKVFAHSNGSLYVTRGTGTNGVIRVDPVTGSQTALANPFTTFSSSPMGITEGRDHMLYVSAVGSGLTVPSVIKIDPVSGAMTAVASGLSNGNVRDLAFDTRDSLFVIRISAPVSLHRVDQTTGQIGQLASYSGFATSFFGNMASHPDGGLYLPGSPTTGLNAMYRVNPVTRSLTAVTPTQAAIGFQTVAVMQGYSGCPTPVNRSTWGELKTRYR